MALEVDHWRLWRSCPLYRKIRSIGAWVRPSAWWSNSQVQIVLYQNSQINRLKRALWSWRKRRIGLERINKILRRFVTDLRMHALYCSHEAFDNRWTTELHIKVLPGNVTLFARLTYQLRIRVGSAKLFVHPTTWALDKKAAPNLVYKTYVKPQWRKWIEHILTPKLWKATKPLIFVVEVIHLIFGWKTY